MGSYEEWVVDREVEAAWLQFKVRLADHLSSMGEGEAFALCVRGADDTIAVGLHIRPVGRSGFAAEWDWADEMDRRGARHERPTRFSSQQLDSYVRRIHDVLRAEGVQHPVFIEVHESDLVLVDPPKEVVSRPSKPETPDSIVPSSPEDLKMWVDRVLAERLGREPKENKDGSVSLFRNGSFVTIRLSSSRPIIEVWSTVARDVDVRKARKHVAQMNARFHFFAFALVGNKIFVASTVNARPFCPEHLNRAIDATFGYLDSDAPQLEAKLARRETKAEKTPSEAPSNAIDGDLLLVFGASGDRGAMVQMARGLTHDSRDRLGQWRNAARDAADGARAKAALGGAEVVQNALIDQVIAWRSVADALEGAVAEILAEKEGSR